MAGEDEKRIEIIQRSRLLYTVALSRKQLFGVLFGRCHSDYLSNIIGNSSFFRGKVLLICPAWKGK